MGRQRFNKKDWIEKANRLFESRNRKTIMEQVGTGTTVTTTGTTINGIRNCCDHSISHRFDLIYHIYQQC